MKPRIYSLIRLAAQLEVRNNLNYCCRNLSTSSVLSAKWEDTFITKDKPTFFYDESMPSLPVPKLDDTLSMYLSSVQPHLTPEEFLTTEKVVKEFQKGTGKDLQKDLEELGRTKKNWLSDWWEEYAYFRVRTPTIPTQNIILVNEGVGCREAVPSGQPVYEKAARQLYWAVRFWSILLEEKLRPERLVDGTQVNMNQFRRMYCMNRLPGETADRLHTYWKTASEGKSPTHCVVLCRGHFYKVNVLTSSGKLINVEDWIHILDEIWNQSQSSRGPGVGILSVDERTGWYKNREHLKKIDAKNFESLEMIDQAMFAIVLDENEPRHETLHWEVSCGDLQNRWGDKSMICVVYRNGMFSWNMDHTPVDGMAPITMVTFSQTAMASPGTSYTESASEGVSMPEKYDFIVDDTIKQQIQHVLEKSEFLKNDAHYRVEYIENIGKSKLREVRVHPDAFVQLNMQLAYMRIHGKPAPCYETATTRQFYNARTETVRTCTNEAVAWARAMLDKNTDKSHRRDLLTKAGNSFLSVMKQCKDGRGCDRHLLGLKLLALERGLPLPGIYNDAGWTRSGGDGNFVLSSSLLGYSPVTGGTIPMCPNGHGTFYNIQNNRIQFMLTQFKSSPEMDVNNYFKSLQESCMETALLFD